MAGDDDQARGSNGKFITTLGTAERQARAAGLRSQGLPYRKIAEQMGVSVHQAHNDVQAALRAIVEEPAQDVLRLELDRLDAELERLNGLEESVREVLERQHLTVSNGRIIYMGEGEPLIDDAPVLQAVDRLIRIDESRRRNSESRRKLLGLDAPTKTQVTGGVTYEIVGIDMDKLR